MFKKSYCSSECVLQFHSVFMSGKKVKFLNEHKIFEQEHHLRPKNNKSLPDDLAIVITWETWTFPQILALIGLMIVAAVITIYQKDLKVRSFHYIEHIEFPNATYVQQTILQLQADTKKVFERNFNTSIVPTLKPIETTLSSFDNMTTGEFGKIRKISNFQFLIIFLANSSS